MLTAVASFVGYVNEAVRLCACANRGADSAANAIRRTIVVNRRDGVFMIRHLSNLRSIAPMWTVCTRNQRVARNQGLQQLVFRNVPGLKSRAGTTRARALLL